MDICKRMKETIREGMKLFEKSEEFVDKVSSLPDEQPDQAVDPVSKAVEFIKQAEGFKAIAYKDTKGIATIGYGFTKATLGEVPDTMDRKESDKLLASEVKLLDSKLAKRVPWYNNLNPARKFAMIDLSYNMGVNFLDKFPQFRQAMSEGDYKEAAKQLLIGRKEGTPSGYFKDVKGRAEYIAEVIKEGKLPDKDLDQYRVKYKGNPQAAINTTMTRYQDV